MFDPWLLQSYSLVGAALVLWGFIGNQFFKLDSHGLVYACVNALGTFLLALSVLRPLNPGLFAVETVWCGASCWSIAKNLRLRLGKTP